MIAPAEVVEPSTTLGFCGRPDCNDLNDKHAEQHPPWGFGTPGGSRLVCFV